MSDLDASPGAGMENGRAVPIQPREKEIAALPRQFAGGDDLWRKLFSDMLVLLISFFVTTMGVGYLAASWWAVGVGAGGFALIVVWLAFRARPGTAIERAPASGLQNRGLDEPARSERRP